MRTLAITGANGFLGKHLVAECLSRDHFKLRLLLRNKNAREYLSNDAVTLCEGDLLRPESLEFFLQPDSTLVHLAYMNSVGPAVNIEATLNLIKATKKAGVKRVVHCSTAVVVGFDAKGVVTENTAPKPKGEYQQTKYRIEELLRAELPSNIELAILRPTEIIGPGGQGLQKMIRRLRNEKKYKNFIYHCLLRSRRFNYVSVYNVVAALILLASAPVNKANGTYNISDDDDSDNNYVSVEEIINSNLKHQPGYPFDIGLSRSFLSALFKLLPNHAPPNRVYSYSKISSLGYKKTIELKAAISEIVSLEANNAHS